MQRRLRALLLGWGSVGLVYYSAGWLNQPAHLLSAGKLDQLIPFTPHAIWLYLSFFLLIPYAYLSCPLSRLVWLTRSMQITALGSGIVFLLYPTTLLYPDFKHDSLSAKLLQGLISIDSQQNCLPSLHVALTILAGWSMLQKQHWLKNSVVIVWAILICLSVIQLKRHLLIDLVTGALLALTAGYSLLRRRND